MLRCGSYIVLLLVLSGLLYAFPRAVYAVDHGMRLGVGMAGEGLDGFIWGSGEPPMITIMVPGGFLEPLLGARVDSLDALVFDAVNERLLRGRVFVVAKHVDVMGAVGVYEDRVLVGSVVEKDTLLYIVLPLVPTVKEPAAYREAWTPYHAVNRIHDGVVLMVPGNVLVEAFNRYSGMGRPVDMGYVASIDKYMFLLLYDKGESLGSDNRFNSILFPNTTLTAHGKIVASNETLKLDSYSIVNNTYSKRDKTRHDTGCREDPSHGIHSITELRGDTGV